MADGATPGELVADQLIGERIAGRFVVERLIGSGELSTAFRAHDERLHRRVTVKLFHPRHRDDAHVAERQLAAARSVARLSHEHIAIVIDRGEHDGMPLVVLEHVRGENLLERIERFAPLAAGEVAAYGLQIARALAYAHGHGVVHGNLRPGNVLLTEEREVKLVDFGGGSYVAQLVGDPYAAPELREVDVDAPAEPTDDIYALGALLYVALTERSPVPGFDPGELQLQRPDMSPRFAAVVARALATSPDDRYLSMRELAAELASVRETSTPAAAEATGVLAFATDQSTQAFAVGGPDDLDDADEDTEAGAAAVVARPRTGAPTRRRRERPAKGERSPSETRARILAWSMVVAPLVALVIFGIMISGERGNDQVDGRQGAGNGPTKAATLAGAVTFDPEPKGDGEEHAAEVANLLDNDLETTWQTEGYDTNDFNIHAKPGVGVVLQLDSPAEVRDVSIATRLPGWTVEVRVPKEPGGAPTTLDGWKRVSKPTPVEDGVRIAVDTKGEKTTHVLLWITGLVIDYDDPNRYRARMSGARVYVVDASGDATGK